MCTSKIFGIILLVVGAICLYFGLSSSIAPVDLISKVATGRFTARTMIYIIGGIALIIGGGALCLRGRSK